MRIGYSFWGFIGPGITDTPDGGRFFRRPLLDALAADHELVLLQENRDLSEAGDDLTSHYTWDTTLPDLDVLFLEWRWPLPGRNTTPCASPGHTCDLHRQQDLLDHYTHNLGLPTIIWDLDRVLDPDDPIRRHPAVTICEPVAIPNPGAITLRSPVPDQAIDTADPHALACAERPWPLVYVGNQYGRDEEFSLYFSPAAKEHRHRVAGKWPATAAWPHVNFTGRAGFREGQSLYREALATVLLLPPRYAAVGYITQRLGESVLAGCLPITPAGIRTADTIIPAPLLAADGHQVSKIVTSLTKAGADTRAELLAACLSRLDPFRLSHQLATIDALLRHT